METKHCPFCDSKKLLYTIDIFKDRMDEKRYTGEVTCEDCDFIFDKKVIKIRYWKELVKNKDEGKKE